MAIPAQPGEALQFEDARRIVEEHAATILNSKLEIVDLLEAAGRTLAVPVLADRDFPPFPRSTRDGFAVRSSDVQQVPATLRVVGELRAGEDPEKISAGVQPGEAVAIMTGAPVPNGANAVVMVEFTHQAGGEIAVRRTVTSGENIVPRGAEAAMGSTLVERGACMHAAAIALAASVGQQRLTVFARPRVAILATGDELVDINATPGAAQIRNSNSSSLATQVKAAAGEPVLLPIAADDADKLRALLQSGLKEDLLLISGGVSVGRYDLVERVLAELGAEFFFTGALIQPGRPVVFGRAAQKYFFGLPGNPVSTMVTFELFVRPMLHAMAGRPVGKLRFLYARLNREIKTKPGLKRFLPAILSGELENVTVELVPWQGSGDLAATARADCYIVVPSDRPVIAAGEWIAVMVPSAAM